MRERESKSRPHVKTLRSNLTKAEVLIWARLKALRSQGYRFRRQHPIENFIVDFANLQHKLAIEIDGATHAEDHEIDRDLERTHKLNQLGWTVMRMSNLDVYRDPDEAVNSILMMLPPPSATLKPPPQAVEEVPASDKEAEQ